VARRVNYGFEKRQRELKKQKKAEEKAARRQRESEADPAGSEAQHGTDADAPAPRVSEQD